MSRWQWEFVHAIVVANLFTVLLVCVSVMLARWVVMAKCWVQAIVARLRRRRPSGPPSIGAPPFHPNCRCVVTDEELDGLDEEEAP
jgi:hypothetical protein